MTTITDSKNLFIPFSSEAHPQQEYEFFRGIEPISGRPTSSIDGPGSLLYGIAARMIEKLCSCNRICLERAQYIEDTDKSDQIFKSNTIHQGNLKIIRPLETVDQAITHPPAPQHLTQNDVDLNLMSLKEINQDHHLTLHGGYEITIDIQHRQASILTPEGSQHTLSGGYSRRHYLDLVFLTHHDDYQNFDIIPLLDKNATLQLPNGFKIDLEFETDAEEIKSLKQLSVVPPWFSFQSIKRFDI